MFYKAIGGVYIGEGAIISRNVCIHSGNHDYKSNKSIPYDNKYIKEYENALIQVIRNEAGLTDLPIITEMDFGHTCPTFTIPYGIKAEIDPINKTFSIVENALEN